MLPEYVKKATVPIAVPEWTLGRLPALLKHVGMSVESPNPANEKPTVAKATARALLLVSPIRLDNDGDDTANISPPKARKPAKKNIVCRPYQSLNRSHKKRPVAMQIINETNP